MHKVIVSSVTSKVSFSDKLSNALVGRWFCVWWNAGTCALHIQCSQFKKGSTSWDTNGTQASNGKFPDQRPTNVLLVLDVHNNLSHDTFYLWKKHHLYTSLTPSSSERNENPDQPSQPANQHATSYTDKEKRNFSLLFSLCHSQTTFLVTEFHVGYKIVLIVTTQLHVYQKRTFWHQIFHAIWKRFVQGYWFIYKNCVFSHIKGFV